ncbi:Ankyrin_repeats-containing protein [Hexamita inflata]|uniref:Ankyrin_repeats-containing protein n=1 Tax=Hexamita inflata TaxID=28002 RepID=A0ABP1HW92_9EUKA
MSNDEIFQTIIDNDQERFAKVIQSQINSVTTEKLFAQRQSATATFAKGTSPLHLAIALNRTYFINQILKRSPDFTKNEAGSWEIHVLSMNEDQNTIEKVLSQIEKYITEQSGSGFTVMHLCAQFNNKVLAQVLREKYPQKFYQLQLIPDFKGKLPCDYAQDDVLKNDINQAIKMASNQLSQQKNSKNEEDKKSQNDLLIKLYQDLLIKRPDLCQSADLEQQTEYIYLKNIDSYTSNLLVLLLLAIGCLFFNHQRESFMIFSFTSGYILLLSKPVNLLKHCFTKASSGFLALGVYFVVQMLEKYYINKIDLIVSYYQILDDSMNTMVLSFSFLQSVCSSVFIKQKNGGQIIITMALGGLTLALSQILKNDNITYISLSFIFGMLIQQLNLALAKTYKQFQQYQFLLSLCGPLFACAIYASKYENHLYILIALTLFQLSKPFNFKVHKNLLDNKDFYILVLFAYKTTYTVYEDPMKMIGLCVLNVIIFIVLAGVFYFNGIWNKFKYGATGIVVINMLLVMKVSKMMG